MPEFPGFELRERLAATKSVAIYRARRLADQQSVIVKLATDPSTCSQTLARFQREHKLLTELAFDGVVQSYGLQRHGDQIGLVLQDLDAGGEYIGDYVAAAGRPPALVLELAVRAVDILGRVHDAGIMHRNITPRSLVVNPLTRALKLVSFNLATRLRSDAGGDFPQLLSGNLAYVSPEQTGRMNRRPDYRADFYSLGAVLYELLTGVPPFTGDDPMELVYCHIAATPPAPADVEPRVPAGVSAIVSKLLAKSPDDRYQSVSGLRADLDTALQTLAATGDVPEFALGEHDTADRFRPMATLFGRGEELEALLAAFAAASAGQPQHVLVTGATGVGKSALVRELKTPASRAGGFFVEGDFETYGEAVPFSAIGDALGKLVQLLLSENAQRLAVWRDAINDALGGNRRRILEVVPALETVIGPQDLSETIDSEVQFAATLLKFIQVFCRREHPLVLFLDDLQRADSASLDLLTRLLVSSDTEALLVVSAYPGGEAVHCQAFQAALAEQRRAGVVLQSICVGPLGVADVAQMIAESMGAVTPSTAELADLMWHKTGGNPFFVIQLFEDLRERGLIDYDARAREFRIDLAGIRRISITDNVAALLAGKVDTLSEASAHLLSHASVIGSHFDLDTLAALTERTPADTAATLGEALERGFVVPTSDIEANDVEQLDAAPVYRRYAFVHERLQRAAYDKVPAERRKALHARIGALLLAAAGDEPTDVQLFDIVNHLNAGVEAIDAKFRRSELAGLNARAADRARASGAYRIAAGYFEQALALCGSDLWSSCHELACAWHIQQAECLFAATDYQEAAAVAAVAAPHAHAPLDLARLSVVRIGALSSVGDMVGALETALAAAARLGFTPPATPQAIRGEARLGIDSVLRRVETHGAQSLLQLPECTDAAATALMNILTSAATAAFNVDLDMFTLMSCRCVHLTLEHGCCNHSPRAFAALGIILGPLSGRHREGDELASLAVALNARLNDPLARPALLFMHGALAAPWTHPLRECVDLLRRCVKAGIQVGDRMHAATAAGASITFELFCGVPLRDVSDRAVGYQQMLMRLGDVGLAELMAPRLALVKWLQGESLGESLLDDGEVVREVLQADSARAWDYARLGRLAVLLMQHRYWQGDYAGTCRFAEAAAGYIPDSMASFPLVERSLFESLAMAALYQDADDRPALLARIDANHARLAAWAGACPVNFRVAQLIVEAERSRITGKAEQALDLYDRAIETAVDYDFRNFEGLACELAGRYWQQRGKPHLADVYFKRACVAYEIWGATPKLLQLRPDAPSQMLDTGEFHVGLNQGSVSHVLGSSLDLITIVKATSAISSEIVFDRLLRTLLNFIVENAGADSAALILESNGQLLVQASKAAAGADVEVLQRLPIDAADCISSGIVNFVTRSGELVVLDDACHASRFSSDDHIVARRPKSVLCAPILHQGKVTGAIYLENNLVTGAFTADRVEAMKILITQIAVSIENASLFRALERQKNAIEESNVALRKEVGERQRAEQELTRYRDHLEELVVERTRDLKDAQERLLEASRQSGMAEVASGVLHNVGNVLNSVNVGLSLVYKGLTALRLDALERVNELLTVHQADLAAFLTEDARGRKLLPYLVEVHKSLAGERSSVLKNLANTLEQLEHMNGIIAAQQDYARAVSVIEETTLAAIAESALEICAVGVDEECIEVVRRYEPLPPMLLDRHQIQQILVNLIANAVNALAASDQIERRITLGIDRIAEDRVQLVVSDNGPGIAPDVMASIFSQGFTTRTDARGFGLHNSANAAQRLQGSLKAFSRGVGQGARFVLELPVKLPAASPVERHSTRRGSAAEIEVVGS